MPDDGPDSTGQSQPQWPEWLRRGLDELDGQVFESTEDPGFNAHVSMFNMLPEHWLGNTIGAEIEIDYDDTDCDEDALFPSKFMPVAMWGGGLVVRDQTIPIEDQDVPQYLMIRGSVYMQPEQVKERNLGQIIQALTATVSRGVPMKAVMSDGLYVIYNPATFCRDARLAHAKVYSFEELSQAESKARTSQVPMVGTVITVPIAGKSKVLFVREPFELSPPVRNVWQYVEDEGVPLLDHVPDEDD